MRGTGGRGRGRRRWARRTGRALAVVVTVVFALWVALQTAPVRRWVRQTLVRELDALLVGEIRAGELRTLRLDRVELRAVSLHDARGHTLASIERLSAVPDWSALLRGRIGVADLHAEGVTVDLGTDPEGNLLLVDAVLPASTSGEESGDEGSSLVVDLERIRVDDATVVVPIGSDEAPIRVEGLRAVGAVRVAEDVVVDVQDARAMVYRGDAELGAVGAVHVHYDTGAEARSEAHVEITGGEDHVIADLELQNSRDAPTVARGRVQLQPLTPRFLRALGEGALADALIERVEGEITVDGPLTAPTVRARLRAGDGTLELEAHELEGGAWEGRACGHSLHLEALHAALPAIALDACLEASVAAPGGAGRAIALKVRDGAIDGTPLPPVDARATVSSGGIEVESLEVLRPDRPSRPVLTADGTLAFDGPIDLHVRAHGLSPRHEAILAELVPGIDGVVDADARVRIVPRAGGAPRLEVTGAVEARSVRGPGFTIASAHLRASTAGTGKRQRIALTGRAESVRIGGLELPTSGLTIRGGPTDYHLVLDARAARGVDVHLELEAHLAERAWHLSGAGEVVRGQHDWQLGLASMVARPDGSLDLEGLRFARGSGAVEVDGNVARGGRMDFRARLIETSFAELAYLAVGDDFGLEGRVDGQIEVRGTKARPTGHLDLRILEAGAAPFRGIGGRIQAELHDAGGRVEVDLGAAGAGQLHVAAEGTWGTRGSLASRVERADVRGQVTVDDLDLALIGRALKLEGDLSGRLAADLELEGRADAPRLRGSLSGTDVALFGAPPLTLAVQASYTDDGAVVHLDADDSTGRLVVADLTVDLPTLLAAEEPSLAETPFRLRLELPARPIGTLPSLGSIFGDSTLRVQARLEATHRAGASPELTASARVDGDALSGALVDSRCDSPAPIDLRAAAWIREGQLRVSLDGAMGGSRVVTARLSSSVDLERWLRGELPDRPAPLDGDLQVAALPLGAVPVVCAQARGTLNGQASLRSLFSPEGRLEAHLGSTDLRLGGAPPLPFGVDLQVNASQVEVRARSDAEGGHLRVSGAVPWEVRDGEPRLGDGPIEARLQLAHFSLEPLTGVAGFTAGHAGTADGDLTVSGTRDDPVVRGRLQLSDASFFVPWLDQRLEHVSGAVRFGADAVVLESLEARDRSGRLRARGRVELVDDVAERFSLDVHSRAFPVRRAGVVLSFITGETHFRGQREPGGWDADLALQDLSLRLPDEADYEVQEMAENPEVQYLPSLSEAPTDESQVFEQAPPPQGLVIEGGNEGRAESLSIHIHSTNLFWVRRQDFAIALSADLHTRADARGFALSGVVRTERGFFELLGRSFDIQRGELTFTGGDVIDPSLDLYATHDLASAPGKRLGVRVRGFASDPELIFLDPNQNVITAGEALQWITTGSGSGFNQGLASDSSATAAQQAQSVVAGLTAGILTTAARHGMGDNVPTISVNTGASIADMQLRAGFDANRLIPDFMKGFVTGLFVQGFVGTESQQSSPDAQRNVRATGGFGVELYHPHNLVTSGEYQPPNNWSLDILWRP